MSVDFFVIHPVYMFTITQESFTISDRKTPLGPTTKGQLKTLFVERDHFAFLCENRDSKAKDFYPFSLSFSHHKSIHNLLFTSYLPFSLSLCFSLTLTDISLEYYLDTSVSLRDKIQDVFSL